MPIASRISITGRGTVLVGTVEQGKIKKGDKVEIKGEDKCVQSIVSDIQVFKKSVHEVSNFYVFYCIMEYPKWGLLIGRFFIHCIENIFCKFSNSFYL